MAHLRIGSRGSQLALWQAEHIAKLLADHGHTSEIEVIKTTGDIITEVALSQVGTKGMFTKEIEEAMAEHRVDLAVHSLKDVPTLLPAGFDLAAILAREDARDAFVSVHHDGIEALPVGAKLGTSSLRRQAQLRALRPDIDIQPLRGNVDTRLRKLEAGEYDAIILAAAGLNRLGRTESVRALIPEDVMCPAAGQGALAIEVRANDLETRQHLAFLDDANARATTECERAALNALGGGCQVPIGAYAVAANGLLRLMAVVARPDGTEIFREQREGKVDAPRRLGDDVGRALMASGGQKVLEDVYRSGLVAVAPHQP